jgi:hypothetical protein
MTPEKREKLIARTCQLILTEGQFDMSTFTGRVGAHCDRKAPPKCGTACCIAGNLDIARRNLRVKVCTLGLSAADQVKAAGHELWCVLHPGTNPEFYAESIQRALHAAAANGYCSLAVSQALGAVTPQMAAAHVVTGLPLETLRQDPALVKAAIRQARRLIRKHFPV